MDDIIVGQTGRIFLRQFVAGDGLHFFRLNADQEVLKYTGDQAFGTIEEAYEFIRNYDAYEKDGMGRWAVISKEKGEFLGWCGLKKHKEGWVDLGFRFHQAHWGKGYATESAMLALQIGFEELKLNKVIGRAMTANGASIRVLEKIGMKWKREERVEGLGKAQIYEIEKPD
ncbi:MAG: GNAT family N-acetyltransferase [Bacteroidota bacterium]